MGMPPVKSRSWSNFFSQFVGLSWLRRCTPVKGFSPKFSAMNLGRGAKHTPRATWPGAMAERDARLSVWCRARRNSDGAHWRHD